MGREKNIEGKGGDNQRLGGLSVYLSKTFRREQGGGEKGCPLGSHITGKRKKREDVITCGGVLWRPMEKARDLVWCIPYEKGEPGILVGRRGAKKKRWGRGGGDENGGPFPRR